MIDFERAEWVRNPEWQQVLAVYKERAEIVQADNPEFDGWLPRIEEADGVDAVRLPHIHGKLIALGFLKFQLTGRTAGIHYRLSLLGLRVLSQHPSDAPLCPADALDLPNAA